MNRQVTTNVPVTRVTYSIEEAAISMGVSSRHVHRLVHTGEMKALRSGRRVLIPADAIGEYLGALTRVAVG